VTTDGDVTARVMQITNGKGAWASINPIGGEASRYVPSCNCCVNRCNSFITAFCTFLQQCACLLCQIAVPDCNVLDCCARSDMVLQVSMQTSDACMQPLQLGGKVHIFSLFKEEVIVPMFDLHFRQIQVQGFWLTQASSSPHHTAIFHKESSEQSSVKVSVFFLTRRILFNRILSSKFSTSTLWQH